MSWLYRLLAFVVILGVTLVGMASTAIQISQADALKIAVKIWYNESGGTINGLTSWNEGEDFASVGIGHFVWYPARQYSPASGFPQLIKYLHAHNVSMPSWLEQQIPPCPWISRGQFMQSFYSPLMVELRQFLASTIPWQAQYLIYRLNRAFPRILASVPDYERPYIRWQFYRVASSLQGVYALVDYVNFKGEGVGYPKNTQGWGLLQVLENMQYAPAALSPVQAFAWSADRVLTRRVEDAPAYKGEERWLAGWRRRVSTYAT